jgi:hypothetical protein
MGQIVDVVRAANDLPAHSAENVPAPA